MDPGGQRGASNPAAMLASLLNKRAKLHEDLRNIEKQVYDLETSYLQDPGQCGNVLKGFEGFLSSSKNTALLKRSRKFQPEDRLFSLSSVTSPASVQGNALCIALLKDPVFHSCHFVLKVFSKPWIKRPSSRLEFKRCLLVIAILGDCMARHSVLRVLLAEEQATGRDDGRSEFGGGRPKGGGIYSNGQGKPKKGRGASRDSKKIRPSADPDFDYDDDAALTL
ncbi:hypothetical protein DKX38_008469 [Salix brachista]|uniref:Chromatin modification-related protein MEAF6 n=1 Tax=Salix brachista TaxID=2182728 RepID=A0A5N5MQW3_9ROSI|nr:hypothetical protein DKX38_008469 [Salix brachista]